MPETNDTSTNLGSGATDTQDEEIGTVEAEDGVTTEASEVEPDLLDPKRHKDLQTWAMRVATENKELRQAVTQALQHQTQTLQPQATEDAVNTYAEKVLREKGAGGVVELAQTIAGEMTKPLFQKMQRMEAMMNNPDYSKLEGRVNTILQDTQSGKTNIDTLLLRLARAEEEVERASKGLSSRKPDDPRRGASTGNRGASIAATETAANLEELSGEALAKLALKDPTTTPGIREWIYENNPGLRQKG